MKQLMTIALLYFSTALFAQPDVYHQKMGEALQGFSSTQTVADYTALAAQFERISGVESQEWLPLYYHAQCYILMSFTDREADGTKKDEYLDVAEASIVKMIELAPEESEVYALQSFLYTGRMVVDPMSRGMSYGQKSNGAIEKSLSFNPTNPRAKYLRLSNETGTANFFGQETTPFCIQAEKLLNEWDQFTPKSTIHPSWGKNLVQGIINDCQTAEETSTSSTTEKEAPKAPTQEAADSSANSHHLTIIVENLPTDSGVVMIELLNDQEESVGGFVGQIQDGVSQIEIADLPKGTYSIQYYHDENQNQKMDANKWGMPIEAYGFSNNARGSFGPPEFEKTLFDLNADLSLSLKAK